MPDPDFKAVLAITPFRRLWLALGFSSFGDWLGLLAITAMADYLAGSNTNAQYLAVAGVFILRLAPAVVLGPLAGAPWPTGSRGAGSWSTATSCGS